MLIAGCGSEGNLGLGSLFDDPGSNSGISSSGSSGGSSALDLVPEPSTSVLLGIGLAGLAAVMLRKKKKG